LYQAQDNPKAQKHKRSNRTISIAFFSLMLLESGATPPAYPGRRRRSHVNRCLDRRGV